MKIFNKIIIIVIAVVGFYAAFLIASDINTISDKISSFKIEFYLLSYRLSHVVGLYYGVDGICY